MDGGYQHHISGFYAVVYVICSNSRQGLLSPLKSTLTSKTHFLSVFLASIPCYGPAQFKIYRMFHIDLYVSFHSKSLVFQLFKFIPSKSRAKGEKMWHKLFAICGLPSRYIIHR